MLKLARSCSPTLVEITLRVRGLGSASGFTFATIVLDRKMSGLRIIETWPNKPDAANPAIASRFQCVSQWRGVADLERYE